MKKIILKTIALLVGLNFYKAMANETNLDFFMNLPAYCTNGWPQGLKSTNFFEGKIISICLSNNVRPAQFQPDYDDPITNIVISTNFNGTIQIGKTYWTVEELQNLSWYKNTATIEKLDTQIAYLDGSADTFRELKLILKTNGVPISKKQESELAEKILGRIP